MAPVKSKHFFPARLGTQLIPAPGMKMEGFQQTAQAAAGS